MSDGPHKEHADAVGLEEASRGRRLLFLEHCRIDWNR